MGSRLLLLVIGAVLVSGCGAGQMTRQPPAARAGPGTPIASAPAGHPRRDSAPSLRMPATIEAASLRSTTGPGILQPGAPVDAADIGPRAAATHDVIFGLADRRTLFGESYPAISTDAGKDWRIDGPRFWYAAADGAATTISVGARAPDMAYAWGNGGNFVKVTTDGGRRWWSADFLAGVDSAGWRDGDLQVRALGHQTADGQFETFLYVSRDDGRTWNLLGRLGNVPY
jgi:hypothetical protein